MNNETPTPQTNESPTQTGYTPGPWEITGREMEKGDYFKIRGTIPGGKWKIANVTTDHFPEESEANARLIASAPDLLEALQWYASAQYPDDGSGRPPEAFQRRAKEAIAKATKC